MELVNQIMELISTLAGIGMMVCAMWLIAAIIKYLDSKEREGEERIKIQQNAIRPKIDPLEHSRDVLEFTKSVIGTITVLKFKEFRDSRQFNMVTRENIERLISNIASSVNRSIDITRLDLKNVVFSQEFYQKYIIDTTIYMVKQLTDKTVSDMIDK